MDTITEQTVGEIASRNPSAARVFERYGIDYCCGGKVTLDQACRERGADLEEVASELTRQPEHASAGRQDWRSAPISGLIQHILDAHHQYLRRELPRLTTLASKVLAAHEQRHGATLRAVQATFLGLKDELESHMWKEEMVLFPLIRELEAGSLAGQPVPPAHCGSVRTPIRVMEHEHDSAGRALAEMRRTAGGYALPEDACKTYRAFFAGLQELEADLHQHIHLENNILFPRAADLEARLT